VRLASSPRSFPRSEAKSAAEAAGRRACLAAVALLALGLGSAPLGAATHTAVSCAQADVQAAVNAASTGDVVMVPAGTCTWTTIATNTPAVLVSGKAITVRGAGVGATVILDETGPSFHEDPVVLQNAGARITGFTFKGMKKRSSTEKAIIVATSCTAWRIDHCQFDVSELAVGSQGSGIEAGGTGVIDHCSFHNTYTSIVVMGTGEASWLQPLSLGTANAVYIEDNTMDNTAIVGDGATDAHSGARYVFRHNSVRNARAGHHGLDSGGRRSPHSFEIYNNTFTWTALNSWYTWRSRGGTGVVFGNAITGNTGTASTFGVVNYRTCGCNWCTNVLPNAHGYPCEPYTACAAPLHTSVGAWGRCDGHNPLDGNLDATGYPCLDQTGRTSDTDGDGVQDAAPLYTWGNTVNGNQALMTVNDPWGCTAPSMADHIKEGRDFFNGVPKPGYVPYTYPHPLTVGATAYYPLPPCRVLDTRVGSGASAAAPALAAQQRRVFVIGGACGVPANAQAVSANLTVVSAQALGDLRVAGGHVTSTITSALSIPLARARANNAIVQLSTSSDGTIAVTNDSSGEAHFILDVNGYFQ
jgi:hypothetical protein